MTEENLALKYILEQELNFKVYVIDLMSMYFKVLIMKCATHTCVML